MKKFSIFNFSFDFTQDPEFAEGQFSNSEKGYTLIELLAVMLVVVTVGTVISGVIVSSLRGSNKSTSVNDIRESGNFVLSQVSKMIIFAKSFDGVSDGTMVNGQLIYTTNCTIANPNPTPPTPTPIHYKYLKITSFDRGQTKFSCDDTVLASNGAELIDTSPATNKYNISGCYIICTQNNISVLPTISISFTLSKKTSSAAFSENSVSIPFETSANFRNNNN